MNDAREPNPQTSSDPEVRLEPCPFCGSTDAFIERATLSSCYVICNDCGARGPESCDETDSDVDESGETDPGRKPAIRRWNTRAHLATIDRLRSDPRTEGVGAEERPDCIEAECWYPQACARIGRCHSEALRQPALPEGEEIIVPDELADLASVLCDELIVRVRDMLDCGEGLCVDDQKLLIQQLIIDRKRAALSQPPEGMRKALEGRDQEVLSDMAAMMGEFVDNWPNPKRVRTALALIAKAMRAALDPPKHDFWGAGEPDCPREIKAGNGELHTLRCKVCGEDNPRNDHCLRAALRSDSNG